MIDNLIYEDLENIGQKIKSGEMNCLMNYQRLIRRFQIYTTT